jgi:stringent starvation protein B
MAETSTKPYLLRALYEWCCDNGYTPYLAVVVDQHTLVPRQHVKNGEIVLNVSPMATSQMALGNELIEFHARFSGVAQQLSIPVENVSAIYARETGHGMAFEVARSAPPGENAEPDAGSDDAHPGTTPANPADAGQAADGASPGRAPEEGAAPRRRIARAGGGADVIAFASTGGGRRKKAGTAKPEADPKTRTEEGDPGGSDPATRDAPDKGGSHATGRSPTAIRGVDRPRKSDDHDEPPPSGGEGGAKGGKTRLTRVK